MVFIHKMGVRFSHGLLFIIMKEKYICSAPFSNLEIQDRENHLCCASWLLKPLPKLNSLEESWNSKEANEVRESMLDGSFKYCDEVQCPYLNQLETLQKTGKTGPLTLKSNISSVLAKKISAYKSGTLKPERIHFGFDQTCNLECPSCRIGLIVANSRQIKEIEATIEEIENTYCNDIKHFYITGSGDPFVSVAFRNFLRNFNPTKFPNLQTIHLHTNATKWNKAMWESMPNIHPFVKTCEISIDAGTKDTYENKTRLGGKWDELIQNLNFISTIPTLRNISLSFVTQDHNYKEMKIFYNLMLSIFGQKATIFYRKITNWGTFNAEEFKARQIWNKNHPLHQDFIVELNKTLPAKQTVDNFKEYLYNYKSTI